MTPRPAPADNAETARMGTNDSPVLRVDELRFGWPGRNLFDGLALTLDPGVNLVCGDESCGKSTLLRLLAGEWAAQSGRFQLLGQTIDPQSDAYRQQVFWIEPDSERHDAGTAINFLAGVRRRHADFSEDALADLIEGFRLQPHLSKPLYMLSKGSKRKVWLSAAFAARTPLTLIDQPFAALDGPSIHFLTTLLQDASRQSRRAWLLADYEVPRAVPLAGTIHCGSPATGTTANQP